MYGSETMIWEEQERSRIRGVQMDKIREMDRVPNTWIMELCGVMNGVDKRIDEGVLRWFGHVERVENDRTTKRV